MMTDLQKQLAELQKQQRELEVKIAKTKAAQTRMDVIAKTFPEKGMENDEVVEALAKLSAAEATIFVKLMMDYTPSLVEEAKQTAQENKAKRTAKKTSIQEEDDENQIGESDEDNSIHPFNF